MGVGICRSRASLSNGNSLLVEFLLIFALGFLAAALIAMLITPAIYGRIVKLTEKRIEATVPLSANEIKGKADLMRAEFASETAKLKTELAKEREDAAAHEFAKNQLQADLATVSGQKTEADQKIADLETEAGDLRSEARKQQQHIDKLSGTVTDYERIKRADDEEISRLGNDLMTISTEVESMKIDLATSSTESVSLRAEIVSLEDQKLNLQQDIKALADTAHDLQEEFRLEQERHAETRIELASTQTSLADRDQQLEDARDEIKALQNVHGELGEALELEQQARDEVRTELATAQSALTSSKIKLTQAEEEIEALQTLRRELMESAASMTKDVEQLESELALERETHEATRRKVAAKQDALDELQEKLKNSDKEIDNQIQKLRQMTEDDRQKAGALKKAEKRIDALNEKLKDTRTALDKSKTAASNLKSKVSEFKSGEKKLRKEAETAAGQLEQLEKRLEEGRERMEQRDTELTMAQKALVARVKELDESKARSNQLETQLEEERGKVVSMDRRIANAEAALESHLNRQSEPEPQTEMPPVEPSQDQDEPRTNGAAKRETRGPRDVEHQVGALKEALQRSNEMSGEFDQQMKKMRKEARLMTPGPRGEILSPEESEPSEREQIETPDMSDGLGRVMQRDELLKTGVEELRDRQRALMADLTSGGNGDDSRLREELADIAALAIGLSAHRGGKLSPVHALITDTEDSVPSQTGRTSLADRARSRIESTGEDT